MTDTRIMKSYVWHADKCFFVSTIDRDFSAMISPAPRFSETIVWEFDWDKDERTNLIHTDGHISGSITKHLLICQQLHDMGTVEASS